MKTGSLIYVIDWQGKKLKRVAVEICGNLVFVCTQEEWNEAVEQRREPISVGWPREAVLGLA